MIVLIIFGNKLISSFSMSAICPFLKYLCYRQTKTSSGNVDIAQRRFGSPRRYPFLTLRRPNLCLDLDPYFGYHWARSTNHRCINLWRQVFLTSVHSRGDNRLWLRFHKYTIFIRCVDQWVKYMQVSSEDICNFLQFKILSLSCW